MVRRVLHIIREEVEEQEEEPFQSASASDGTPTKVGGLSKALSSKPTMRYTRSFSLHTLLDQEVIDEAVACVTKDMQQEGSAKKVMKCDAVQEIEEYMEQRQAILEGINELIEELKDVDTMIAAHAPEHIHANEVILTFGYSHTVAQFLKRGREKREFEVVVAEGAPKLQGYRMAKELSKSNIKTTLIADAACYAMMARANKVLISAHALLADGGVMASVGMAILTAAAKKYNVPVVVLAGIYKLSPNFPHEPGFTFNSFDDPSEILPLSHEAVFAAERADANFSLIEDEKKNEPKALLQIHNPSLDYIPPDRISLFLTDHGHGFMPSYVYRQLSELYNRQDYQLSKTLEASISR